MLRIPKLAYTFIALGTLSLILAGGMYVYEARKQRLSSGLTSVTSRSAPSSVRLSATAIADYTAAPTLPKYLSIASLDVDRTRVLPLGLTASEAMATPDNIYDTGWYNRSSKPGQTGSMFIYGHVSSWKAEGVFYNLNKLKPGALITVTSGDDTVYIYRVEKTRLYAYDKVDMKTVLMPVNPTKPGLSIMTCAGQIIKGTNEFSERLVVFASLAES